MPTDSSSALEIVSGALVQLGHSPIASFSEKTAQAVAAEVLYKMTRRAVLSSHPWNFALREFTVPQLAGLGSGFTRVYDFAYKLPINCLSTHGVLSGSQGGVYWVSEVFGDELYTNLNADTTIGGIRILCTIDITEGIFPPYFADALMMEMTKRLAIPLTDNNTRRAMFAKEAELAWKVARNKDAQGSVNSSLSQALRRLINSKPATRGI